MKKYYSLMVSVSVLLSLVSCGRSIKHIPENFKNNLSDDYAVLTDYIDSETAKTYFYQKKTGNIFVHDYYSDSTIPLQNFISVKNGNGVSAFYSKKDINLGGKMACKIIKDRLFVFDGYSNLFYIDVLNNKLEYVIECDSVCFTDSLISLTHTSWTGKIYKQQLNPELSDKEFEGERIKLEKAEKIFEKEYKEERDALENERMRMIEQEAQNDVSWLYGSWRLETGGFIFWVKITEDKLKWTALSYPGITDVLWDGGYTLYMNRIEVNGVTAFEVNLDRKRIYSLKGEAYRKSN